MITNTVAGIRGTNEYPTLLLSHITHWPTTTANL